MMPVFKCLFSFILLISFASCTSWDRRADVVNVDTKVKPDAQRIEEAKNGILQTKQSLRIALLELRFSKNKDLKGREVILDSRPTYLYNDTAQWTTTQLAFLHGQILPELYQLFRALNQYKISLTILCRNPVDCELFKENMGPGLKKRTQFLFKDFEKALLPKQPLMVISPDEGLFNDLQESSTKWSSWKKSWFQLGRSTTLLEPKDWALLLPSVNEF